VIGFVSGSGFAEKPAMDGLRKCLTEEFSSIYVLNLRGDIRKNMLSKGRAKEGQNIFGSGSMTGIAITLFVKNPDSKQHGQIYHHNIGDDMSREDKLGKINSFTGISGISAIGGWQTIVPDQHGDWLNLRDDRFSKYLVLGDKKGDALKLFDNFSLGVVTNRDAWCYSTSETAVTVNMTRMIDFYNSEAMRFTQTFAGVNRKVREAKVEGFINTDPTQISWTRALKQEVVKNRRFAFDASSLTPSLYRPFTKRWLYFNRRFNEMVYQMPRIFPDAMAENLVIFINGKGSRNGITALISDALVDLNALEAGSQCFPLYLYDEPKTETPDEPDFFANPTPTKGERKRRDALTDTGLAHFLVAYPGETISKEDVFYYVYGLLHSPDYRERYADNLNKELPRIPCVQTAADFWAFSKAGRALAELHLNYETVLPYPVKIDSGGKILTDADYRVEKMKYGKKDKDKDLTTLHYNDKITLTGIPLEAYDYIVNGKPALDWVVERQCVKTDKDSGIINDANDWAVDTMKNPRYPLELFQRVITVSLETMKIVSSLPGLEI